ncbi:MAG: transcriptional regulator, partial [Mesorhizobium sp.]
MSNLKETEATQAAGEVPVKEQTPDTKAPKTRKRTAQRAGAIRTRAASSALQASSSKAIASPTVRAARRNYSENERAQKLGEIEKQIGRGESIKAAVQNAGISEQTY